MDALKKNYGRDTITMRYGVSLLYDVQFLFLFLFNMEHSLLNFQSSHP